MEVDLRVIGPQLDSKEISEVRWTQLSRQRSVDLKVQNPARV
jgi:hypothetical protein